MPLEEDLKMYVGYTQYGIVGLSKNENLNKSL